MYNLVIRCEEDSTVGLLSKTKRDCKFSMGEDLPT